MSNSDKIKKSKDGIKLSQSLNVTYGLHEIYEELLKRTDDKYFQANIFVQIVSANESFFKESISCLINFNTKYLENSKAIIKKVGFKFELEDIFHISKSTITLGDLIAYSLKYSSIESLLKTFHEISEIDVLNELSEVENSLKNDYAYTEPFLISDERPLDKNRIIKNLKEVYEIRNIICHDFLSATHKLSFDISKLKNYILDTIVLHDAMVQLCSDKIYTVYIPLDYDERIKYYQGIVDEKEDELNKLYILIENGKNEEYNLLLKNSIKAFDNYLEADSKYFGNVEDMFLDLTLENKIKLIDQRIRHLKEEINKTE